MNLTLSLDEYTIARAREVAKASGKSLNQLVREYLQGLAGVMDPDETITRLRQLRAQGGETPEARRFTGRTPMTERSFLDTNVLLCADDAGSGSKQNTAIELIEAGFRSRKAVISTQVLQEYFVNATRKLGIASEVARASVELYQSMHTVVLLPEDVLEAIDVHRLHSISLWDSLLLSTAAKSGCKILYSEDLQNGRRFGSVRVVNPF